MCYLKYSCIRWYMDMEKHRKVSPKNLCFVSHLLPAIMCFVLAVFCADFVPTLGIRSLASWDHWKRFYVNHRVQRRSKLYGIRFQPINMCDWVLWELKESCVLNPSYGWAKKKRNLCGVACQDEKKKNRYVWSEDENFVHMQVCMGVE